MTKFLNTIGKIIGFIASIGVMVGALLPYIVYGDSGFVLGMIYLRDYSEKGLAMLLIISLLALFLFYKGYGLATFLLGIVIFIMDFIIYLNEPVSNKLKEVDELLPFSDVAKEMINPGIGMFVILGAAVMMILASMLVRVEGKNSDKSDNKEKQSES